MSTSASNIVLAEVVVAPPLSSNDQRYMAHAYSYRNVVMCVATINGIISLSYMYFTLYVGWIHFFFSIIGYFAAKYYNSGSLGCYLIFQFLCLVAEIAYAIIYVSELESPNIWYVWFILGINLIIGIYSCWLTFNLIKYLAKISNRGITELRIGEQLYDRVFIWY